MDLRHMSREDLLLLLQQQQMNLKTNENVVN